MKVITADVKAKIFSQYIGQRFITTKAKESSEFFKITYFTCSHVESLHELFLDAKIELKSLQNISDEDSIEVAKYLNWGRDIIKRRLNGEVRGDQNIDELKQTYIRVGKESVMVFLGKSVDTVSTSQLEYNNCFQFLQSKGYALPYMDFSVEELVELGVYKLI